MRDKASMQEPVVNASSTEGTRDLDVAAIGLNRRVNNSFVFAEPKRLVLNETQADHNGKMEAYR